jgi:hypothetical protein
VLARRLGRLLVALLLVIDRRRQIGYRLALPVGRLGVEARHRRVDRLPARVVEALVVALQ